MKQLTDKQLIESYLKAKEITEIDKQFIELLEEELSKRGLLENKKPKNYA